MELWTEYEGRTIDGAFPLTKLIRPEGRSAFFSTSNGIGGPTVIRLIESHFDDEEILVRWRGIQVLNHPNLVKLIQYGQVTLDETSLVYAVMEPVDANMSEIVAERRLTVVETKQIATNLLKALEALHANGFVHEHLEPANVLAVGETIKLRSDCIRETPEGQEGRERKSRDVHDFAVVLLQALTQKKTLEEAKRDLPLDAPYDEIIRKGISGEWGLPEIAAALRPETEVLIVARPVPKSEPRAESPANSVSPVEAVAEVPTYPTGRVQVPVEVETRGIEGRRLAIGVGAMVLLLVVAFVVHGRWAKSSGAVEANAALPAEAQQSATATTPGLDQPPAEGAAAVSAAPALATPDVSTSEPVATGQWRVVSFTFNRESQAQQKAAGIAAKHPELRPEVFTPSGHAPYLVTIGGTMSRDDAFALARKAKSEGLPRDSYAQNYRTTR